MEKLSTWEVLETLMDLWDNGDLTEHQQKAVWAARETVRHINDIEGYHGHMIYKLFDWSKKE